MREILHSVQNDSSDEILRLRLRMTKEGLFIVVMLSETKHLDFVLSYKRERTLPNKIRNVSFDFSSQHCSILMKSGQKVYFWRISK